MKKVIIAIIVVLVIAGIGFGIFAGVQSCNAGSGVQSVDVSAKTQSRFTQLESEYAIGDPIAFRVEVTSNTKFTKMTYSLNNGVDVSVTVKTGETQEMGNPFGNGKYFIDSGTEIIESDNLTAGYYTLVVKVHDDEGTTVQIGEPRLIKIVASAAAA